jgi:hypothetical protein
MKNLVILLSQGTELRYLCAQLFPEEACPGCHDCHGPPPAVRVALLDEVTRRQRRVRVTGPDLFSNWRNEDCRLRDPPDKDGSSEMESYAIACLRVPKIAHKACTFTRELQRYLVSHEALHASLIVPISTKYGSYLRQKYHREFPDYCRRQAEKKARR